MAVRALRETCHHIGWVRRPMTALAGWYRLVLILMAGHTKYRFMFGIAADKHLESTLMTGSTHFVRCIRCYEDSRRHMGLVTFFAFSGHHIRTVRLVTLGTQRNFAMDIMTEAACQTGMFALDLLQFDDLTGVTGQTLFGDIVCKLDNFRGMRIVMTAHTTGQTIVGLAGMALAADRNNLFY